MDDQSPCVGYPLHCAEHRVPYRLAVLRGVKLPDVLTLREKAISEGLHLDRGVERCESNDTGHHKVSGSLAREVEVAGFVNEDEQGVRNRVTDGEHGANLSPSSDTVRMLKRYLPISAASPAVMRSSSS